MDNLKLDFEQARAKHLLFKSKLRSILYGAEVDEAPVLSHHECTVGKWIYGHALTAYGHIPEMNDLERVHADIHTKARELVAQYKAGKVDDARVGLTEMENIADNLIGLLGKVEQKIEGEQLSPDKPDYQSMEVSLKELADLARANEELDRIIRAQSGQLVYERQWLYNVLMQLPANISVLKGKDHVIELVNPPSKEYIGNRDIIGKPARAAFPELEGQGFYELLDSVYHTGTPYIGKALPATISKDGIQSVVYADISYVPLLTKEGVVEGIISFSYDVTEAVLARKRAEESEAHFRFMSNALPVQTWTADAGGTVDFVNEQMEKFYGLPAQEILQNGWAKFVHSNDMKPLLDKWFHSVQTLEPFEAEFRVQNAKGEFRWHLGRANAFVQSGQNARWFGSNTDINDMKMLQEQLKQSYEDLEVKVKFRNMELERANLDLQKQLAQLTSS